MAKIFAAQAQSVSTGTAVGDGVWVDLSDKNWDFPITVDVRSSAAWDAGDVVQVRGSNLGTGAGNNRPPANNTHGMQLGADITAEGIVTITSPVKYIKVRKSAAGGGSPRTITAWYGGFVIG